MCHMFEFMHVLQHLMVKTLNRMIQMTRMTL